MKAVDVHQRRSSSVLGGISSLDHRAILGIFQHVQLPNTARVFGEPAIPTFARPSFPAGIDDCMGFTEPEVHAEPAQAKIFDLPVRMMHIHTDRKCDTATVLFSDGASTVMSPCTMSLWKLTSTERLIFN